MARSLRRRPSQMRTACCLLAVWLLVPVPALAQESQFFDSDGVQIHYVDQGEGELVVLVHGFLASYVNNWAAPGIMEALRTAGYRVIALDCRGHGQSGVPHGHDSYGLEMVGDIVRLLDHVDIERAHVVGYSMGGTITNKLRADHSDRLLTATLGAAGWAGEDLTELAADIRRRADGLENRDMGPVLRRFAPRGVTVPDEAIASSNEAVFARNDPKVLAAITRGFLELSDISADSLRANQVPTLAMVGDRDPEVEGVDRLAEVMAGLEVVKIPAATHGNAGGEPVFIESLIAFLDKH